MATTDTAASDITPEYGLLTWDAEGMEKPGSKFHSRVLHVPTPSSGLTLGRGYDMGNRTAAKIAQDLIASGVAAADAAKISKAAGLFGAAASKFIAANGLANFEITPQAQKKLFLITYADERAVVTRISEREDTVKAYGACDWSKIDQAIIDLVVDLKYRGDYTPTSRAWVQRPMAQNDLPALAKAIKLRSNWPNVPEDRFKRRCDFADKALAARRA